MATNVFLATSDVKNYLNISSTITTYDDDIAVFIPIVLHDIVAYTNNNYLDPYHYAQSFEVVFASTGTITLESDSTSDWNKLVQSGETVYVHNAWFNNDKFFSIGSISSSFVLVVNETPVSESSSDFLDIRKRSNWVTISRCYFPEDIKYTGAQMVWYKLRNSTNIQGDNITSESLGDYSHSFRDSGKAGFRGYPQATLDTLKRVMPIW